MKLADVPTVDKSDGYLEVPEHDLETWDTWVGDIDALNMVAVTTRSAHYLAMITIISGSLNNVGVGPISALLRHKLSIWSGQMRSREASLASLPFIRG